MPTLREHSIAPSGHFSQESEEDSNNKQIARARSALHSAAVCAAQARLLLLRGRRFESAGRRIAAVSRLIDAAELFVNGILLLNGDNTESAAAEALPPSDAVADLVTAGVM